MKKAALLIVDGAGIRTEQAGNAVTRATMPFFFRLLDRYGYATLEASGPPVGLEAGMVGNSEVGHTVIGAGFVPSGSLQRINSSYEDGTWQQHDIWQSLVNAPFVHIVGLLSDAGVHGHWRTIRQAAELAKIACPASQVVVHLILDGVDSKAGSAPDLLARFDGQELGLIMGRQWFCDRSGDLSLTQRFVDALTGVHELPKFTKVALQDHLAHAGEASFPAHQAGLHFVRSGEPVVLTVHRADRAQQSARLLEKRCRLHSLIELGEVVPRDRVFFPIQPLQSGLIFEFKKHNVGNTRIAEQSKFPHVTRFMNGLNAPADEVCISIPSLPDRDLPENPEMSLPKLLDSVFNVLKAVDKPHVLIANIANLDQIGHLGRLDLAEKAATYVDGGIKQIYEVCQREGWELIVTSDHGNADQMLDDGGAPFNSHSPHPVPFMVIPSHGAPPSWRSKTGSLANVAPTLLNLMGIDRPVNMAESLVE